MNPSPRTRHLASCGLIATLAAIVSLSPMTCGADVASIDLASTLTVPSLNWPDGTWTMRAIEVDASGVPVGDLSAQISFPLTNEWPSIEITMTATAPPDHRLFLYRRLGSDISPGDSNIEYFDYTCSTNLPCDATVPSNLALANTLSWQTGTVLSSQIFADGFENGDTNAWSTASP